jgi:hypothetical protein
MPLAKLTVLRAARTTVAAPSPDAAAPRGAAAACCRAQDRRRGRGSLRPAASATAWHTEPHPAPWPLSSGGVRRAMRYAGAPAQRQPAGCSRPPPPPRPPERRGGGIEAAPKVLRVAPWVARNQVGGSGRLSPLQCGRGGPGRLRGLGGSGLRFGLTHALVRPISSLADRAAIRGLDRPAPMNGPLAGTRLGASGGGGGGRAAQPPRGEGAARDLCARRGWIF